MSKSKIYIVGDDRELAERVRSQHAGENCTVHHYSVQQWNDGLENSIFRNQIFHGVPTWSSTPKDQTMSNVLPFPSMTSPSSSQVLDSKVATMNELESKAIENAINQFKGNLTEAAKALGIGRATLYRKVKLYQIDPANSRRKRAA